MRSARSICGIFWRSDGGWSWQPPFWQPWLPPSIPWPTLSSTGRRPTFFPPQNQM